MKYFVFMLLVVSLLRAPGFTAAQDATGAPSASASKDDKDPQIPSDVPPPQPGATQEVNRDEDTLEASETSQGPQRRLVEWNQYEGPYMTFRIGAGFLIDFAGYAQDNQSKQQIALTPDYKLRDFRLVMGGKFPKLKRSVTWCFGLMYDRPNDTWLVRKSGIMFAVPELWGYFFIGRDKEGFSLNKVMTGYDGWTMERSTMSDATIPILGDGFRWLGYTKKRHFLWNLGYFNDIMSKGQSFSTYSSQAVARLIWLPIHSEENGTLLHVGPNLRWGKPLDNKLQLRSRPESYGASYFVDTGKFDAESTRIVGPEAYYRKRSLMVGGEYWWTLVSSKSQGDPVFHGGDVVATYLLTGETRAYNTVGGYFRDISPKRTVFNGGKGAWELVLRYSYIDLDSKNLRGGKFRRITPMVNWYLSDNIRLEMAYGYGHLDRFNLSGNTQFFQSRVQLQF
jgi:phosphate-selective porin OprO and OprP